ncbi:sensor histidine kinase [Perlabentimonas gracilis]|uniref:sensor histidine kinase n=1 Tax=Perlabentimonas gracilis TaxID=2715279 RepID=UPI00140BA81F|nr:ATP-binding protein [Perlabentimonas gracilis]NHB67704.1 HAMP domain-containing protein [Perlabentimonas gracilis]
MKLRTQITILFTLITATILLAFASVVYYSSKHSREREFFNLLKDEAITKANLFFEANVDTLTLQSIYRMNREVINEVEVAIYDRRFKLLYHDAVDIDIVQETEEMINQIMQNGELRFMQNDWQVIGITYTNNQETYAITAAAFDGYGYTKLHNLRQTLFVLSSLSIVVLYLLGLFLSKRAFAPIKEVISNAKSITATNLDLRLKSSEKKDELSELSNTFNEMLDRLENSFDAQKQFVYNISHELRTPLSAIIAELELSLGKEKNTQEYRTAIENTLNDARKLVKLSNSLLDLAKASYDPTEIKFKPLRVDELVLDARHQVLRLNPTYSIDIRFEQNFDDDQKLTISGNQYLLTVAFANLLENGCKFSEDSRCMVSIEVDKSDVTLKFIDNGVGISEEELENIFTPFYRGANKSISAGYGIGLPLTQKIVQLHKGSIRVKSAQGQGAEFCVIFECLPSTL